MSFNGPTVAILYFICGLTTAVWQVHHNFRGGENSIYRQRLKALPTMPSPRAILVGQYILAVGTVILWPLVIARWAYTRWQARRENALYLNSKLTRLRSALADRESDYEQVFTEHNLPIVAEAIRTLDLKRLGDGASYASVAHCALGFTEYMVHYTKFQWGRRRSSEAEKRRAQQIRQGLHDRYNEDMIAAGRFIGLLIVGHVSGRLPHFELNAARAWYGTHLLTEYDTNEHAFAMFEAIAARNCKRAPDFKWEDNS